MWMTREAIAEKLGIVPNSVRGKVQKGQIERKVEDGKNYYRVAGESKVEETPRVSAPPKKGPTPQPVVHRPMEIATPPPPPRPAVTRSGEFDPKQTLLDQIAELRLDRGIDAIEKGDEIDLATGEISRELDAKISARHFKRLKEIEDALERIKSGDYGACEDCAEPIPVQRLKLFPAARLCVRCQEEMDQYEKFRDNQGGLRGGAWRDEPADAGGYRAVED